jgi:hypothetical protein
MDSENVMTNSTNTEAIERLIESARNLGRERFIRQLLEWAGPEIDAAIAAGDGSAVAVLDRLLQFVKTF